MSVSPPYAETERRVGRVLDFIRDTLAEAHVSEPAGRGAGWSVDYDEEGVKAFIIEQLVDRPLGVSAEVSDLVQFQKYLTVLRADEGDSVTLLCDNPEGPPNNAVTCCGSWTGWMERRFEGETLAAAVEAAVAARAKSGTAPPPDLGGFRCDGTYRLPRDHPADVIGYCWEVNAEHPRLIGKPYDGGGDRVALGERGPIWFEAPIPRNPWGLTQIWVMRNGQEVRATWKERT